MILFEDEYEVRWLAGLLEGEGFFGVIKNHASNGRVYLYPRVGVTMSDRDVIDRAAKTFGTKVFVMPPRDRGRLTLYRVVAMGKPAVTLMERLYTHMGIRRKKQIDYALSVHYAKPDPDSARRSWSVEAAKEKIRDGKGRFSTKGKKP